MTLAIAAMMLAAAPSQAGRMHYAAIPAEQAEAATDATSHFRCEKRPFDLSKGLFCYGPAAMRHAYGIDALIASGADGRGQTIVIIDAFGSPFIDADLQLFNSVFGLPAANFQQIYMPGTPAFDPANGNVVGWTGEIALDVEWSHAMAPAAKIILVAAKSDYDQDLTDALNYALDNLNPNTVSMSFGESELVLANPAGLDAVKAWNAAFSKARQQHVTLFVSSGDQGVDTQSIGTPSVSWPSASALVTSVGGTNLFFGAGGAADPNGSYLAEQVWNDGFGAGGGGMSILTQAPAFQKTLPAATRKTLHGYRGVPDLAMNAGVVGGVIAAWSAHGTGFYIFGGTSAGAPEWAGIIADVNGVLGRSVGFLNAKLYALGAAGQLAALSHDVTLGDNGFDGVPGYPATPGFDLSTGWGTANVARLPQIMRSLPDDDGSAP